MTQSAQVRGPSAAVMQRHRRDTSLRIQQDSLVKTDRAANRAKSDLRTVMRSTGLGKLGNAIGSGSDLKKGGRVHKRGENSFSVSGWVHMRSKSERAIGAFKAYSQGADIGPVKGQWLWIATANIPKKSGRYRMTPALYVANGFEQKLGELQFVQGRNAGEGLLVIKNPVAVNRVGRPNARRFTNRSRIGGVREKKENVVAFVGIRRTSRRARFNLRALLESAADPILNSTTSLGGDQ